jgi:hypothetical protein
MQTIEDRRQKPEDRRRRLVIIFCYLLSVICFLILVGAKGSCWHKENDEKVSTGSSVINNDIWRPMSETDTPSGVAYFSAVWADKSMLIWGGFNETGSYSRRGGFYRLPDITETNPWGTMTIELGDWSNLTTPDIISGRSYHTAVWTGTVAEGGTGEMLVWGGFDADNFLDDGARYNQTLNTWVAITSTAAPSARAGHTAIWTGNGSELWRNTMLIWGGDLNGVSNNGAGYKPVLDTWTPITASGMPVVRAYHTAVWTGTEMIVWGGSDGSSLLSSGGIYDPSSDEWSLINTSNAPVGRMNHTAVWTGSEMIIWGGRDSGGNALSTGGRYKPTTYAWTPITSTNITGRWGHTAIWTGSKMIIWGGVDQDGNYLNTGASYDPVTNIWKAINTTGVPSGRVYHKAVWTGTIAEGGTGEMLIWGGWDGTKCLNTGGRYKP